MTPSTRMVVMVVDLNGPMDKIRYSNAGRSVNPNGPLLRQALVEIGEELDRQAAGDKSLAFCPFGPIDAYLPDDAGAALSKSLSLSSSKVGLLRFDQPRLPDLLDLPKLVVGAWKPGAKPAKSRLVSLQVTPASVTVTKVNGESIAVLDLADLQHVRVDGSGWFFFVRRDVKEEPLALRITPWLVPGLALLVAKAARRGELKKLEAGIEKKAQTL